MAEENTEIKRKENEIVNWLMMIVYPKYFSLCSPVFHALPALGKVQLTETELTIH